MSMIATRTEEGPARLGLKGRLGFLFKDSLLYGGVAALNKSFALLTFPLLARHFSVADYGLVDFFSVLSNFFAILFVFGQDSAVARFFYQYRNQASKRLVVSQSFWLQTGGIVLFMPLLVLFVYRFASEVHSAPETRLLLGLLLAQAPFLLFQNFSQNLLKWTFERKKYLWLSLSTTLGRVLVLLVAILHFRAGVVGFFWANLLVSVVSGVGGLLLVRKWLSFPRGMALLDKLIPYAAPMGVIACLGAFVPALERSVISRLLGSEELGLYAAGSKVALLVALPIQAFQMAWGPFSLSIYQQADSRMTYNWVFRWLALGLCVCVLVLSAAAYPLLVVLGSEKYAAAALVVFPLAAKLAVEALGWIPAVGIDIAKRTSLNMYSYLVFVLLSLGAMYVLGSRYGLVGLAWGILVGQMGKSALDAYLGGRCWNMGLRFGGVVALIAATCGAGLATLTAYGALGPWWSGGVSLCAVAVIALLGWGILFTEEERRRVLDGLRLSRAAVTTFGGRP